MRIIVIIRQAIIIMSVIENCWRLSRAASLFRLVLSRPRKLWTSTEKDIYHNMPESTLPSVEPRSAWRLDPVLATYLLENPGKTFASLTPWDKYIIEWMISERIQVIRSHLIQAIFNPTAEVTALRELVIHRQSFYPTQMGH